MGWFFSFLIGLSEVGARLCQCLRLSEVKLAVEWDLTGILNTNTSSFSKPSLPVHIWLSRACQNLQLSLTHRQWLLVVCYSYSKYAKIFSGPVFGLFAFPDAIFSSHQMTKDHYLSEVYIFRLKAKTRTTYSTLFATSAVFITIPCLWNKTAQLNRPILWMTKKDRLIKKYNLWILIFCERYELCNFPIF